ncbi:FAP20 protein, partial [Formicarius rufipectus]|nr:FAP20 protein [Formicarius rufipectus]
VCLHRTSTDRCSWFEKEALKECEKAWILLLKTINQDLPGTVWDTVPPLPEFVEKSAEEESPGHQEVFTVGMKDFQWVPFPAFHKGKHLNPKDLSSQQPTQSQSHESHPGQGPADKLCSSPSTAEKTCRGTGTDQAKTAVGEDTSISTLEVNPKSCKLSGHRS